MKNTRDEIRIVSTHLDLSEEDLDRALRERFYNDKESWQKFLRLFLISLGIGFSVAGIIFFFAYNWADLHKFAKIGLTQGLLIAAASLTLFLKVNPMIRNILLSASAVLIGVLFAVYGQIYQTGANAYDFFLGWTIFATLWVVVSGFPPLWLIYLVLIETTISLYAKQVARDWSDLSVLAILFSINVVALIISILLSKNKAIPKWFLQILSLATAWFATNGIVSGIFSQYEHSFLFLLIATAIVYALGVAQGIKARSIFYLALIAFSLIVIGSAFLIKVSDGESMLLFVSLFIIGSVTFSIKQLIDLQKKWSHEIQG